MTSAFDPDLVFLLLDNTLPGDTVPGDTVPGDTITDGNTTVPGDTGTTGNTIPQITDTLGASLAG
ncbi:MAG TPA: hypothetical protein V6D21_07155, partial [Candidatus Obscuribacterales bacterium]